jgi:hypothetical protein
VFNLNAFGKHFLYKMSQKDADGVSLLQKLHDKMSDPKETGKSIRRWMLENTEGIGIDNKVISFTMLVAGHDDDDVMVLDRVQVRQLWDDGRFADRNLYDGRTNDEGKPVSGSAMSELTYGARGLLVYEAIERAIQRKIGEIYKAVGRPEAASVGRYHWETWVADSQQEASHGTLDAILAEARGSNNPLEGVTAKEGEYGGYAYGARYGRDVEGTPNFSYETPTGGQYRFTVPAFREFLEQVKAPRNGVYPNGFKVTEVGNAPWYNKPGVNKEKLDALAQQYGSAQGDRGRILQPHARPDAQGQELSDGAGSGAGPRLAARRGGEANKEGLRPATPEQFIKARDASKRPGYLSPLEPSDIAIHQLYLSKDGTYGAAVDPHGDIQNVFNNGGPKGAGGKALVAAIENGGRTLDCYAGFLPSFYRQFGFVETGRMKFNPDFASKDWNFARDGHPDVVFMAWKGYPEGGSDAALQRAGDRAAWIENEESTKYGTDWDEAKRESRSAAQQGGAEASRLLRENEGAGLDGRAREPDHRSGEEPGRDLKLGEGSRALVPTDDFAARAEEVGPRLLCHSPLGSLQAPC